MTKDVYIQRCEKCREEVYGIMTSSFADVMTILYECHNCGCIWSEDKKISLDLKRQNKSSGSTDGLSDNQ